MTKSFDVRLLELAATQAGAVGRRQFIKDLKGSDHGARRRVDRGILTRPYPGVYLHAGFPDTKVQQLWVAYLAAGNDAAYVGGKSAGAFHDMTGIVGATATIVVPHGHHQHFHEEENGDRQMLIRQTRRPWTGSNLVVIEGLKVSDPAATIVDLAGELTHSHLFRLCNDAFHDRKTQLAAVARAKAFGDYPNRPGAERLASVLDELSPGAGLEQSVLEQMFHAAVAEAGYEPYEKQVSFPGREHPKYTADAGDGPALLLVETDGRKWHDRIEARRRDIYRDRQAARHGLHTERILWEELRDDPRGTIDELEEIRQVRRRQFGRLSG